jgi:L-threonylcarbamoyladenylate synthase
MSRVIDADGEGIGSTAHQVAEALARGGLVVLPTDTVYGLAASVRQPDAVRSIFAIKGRRSEKSLVVMVAGLSEAEGLVAEDGRDGLRRLAVFWPGKLTIVAKRDPVAWMEVAAPGQDSLALRVPDHPLVLAVLALTGPLAVTSANRSGEDAPTDFSEVPDEILRMVEVACCSRHPGDGVPSTVVTAGVTGPRILRPGDISLEELKKAWRRQPAD